MGSEIKCPFPSKIYIDIYVRSIFFPTDTTVEILGSGHRTNPEQDHIIEFRSGRTRHIHGHSFRGSCLI